MVKYLFLYGIKYQLNNYQFIPIHITWLPTPDVMVTKTRHHGYQNALLWLPALVFALNTRKLSESEYFHTQRNIFEILLNQPEIRLYLPFSD